jgi:hypothetical protein
MVFCTNYIYIQVNQLGMQLSDWTGNIILENLLVVSMLHKHHSNKKIISINIENQMNINMFVSINCCANRYM